MDASIIVAAVAAIGSLVAAGMAFRSASAANRSNDRKVDLEEHRDSIERLRKIIDEQDKHVERVRAQLGRVQEQLEHEQEVSAALRAQIRILQIQVDELTQSRKRLEALLTDHSHEHNPERKA